MKQPSAQKQPSPKHEKLEGLPSNPRELRRYLSALALPKQDITPPTPEEVKLLEHTLRNHRPGPWQRRELAQLIRGLSVAFLTHAILLIVALSTAGDISLVQREKDNSERFVRPIWIQAEPKKEKKPNKPAIEKTEQEPEKHILAKAPTKPPVEKPKLKTKAKKRRTVQKKKEVVQKESVAVITSEAPEAPMNDVKNVDDGATGKEAAQ